MNTTVTITATFKHGKHFNFASVRDGILIGIRDAFMDDLEVVGDVAIESAQQKEPTAFGFDIYDVIEHGKQNGYRISKKRAREIIERMNSKGDVSVGISWDTVLFFIEESFGKWG